MKHHYLPLALALALAPAALAQSKFDASSQIAVEYYRQFVNDPGRQLPELPNCPIKLNAKARTASTAQVLVILNPGGTAADLEQYGIEVMDVIGDVAVCNGTMDDILNMSQSDKVLQVSFAQQLEAKLDRTRTATGVDVIHAGTGLQEAYDGTGIITGIYDIGMDPNHANFKYDDGYPRVNDLWYFSPSGVSSYYSSAKMSGFSTDATDETHGAHTMGCMAGSYKGTGKYATVGSNGRVSVVEDNIPFYGMAPGATIMAACGVSTSANILSGLTKIKDAILAAEMPGLLSLSFGSNLGPHDGTDAETRALNELAKVMPFYIAAGNEGSDNISVVCDIESEEDMKGTFLDMAGSSTNGEIQVWGRDNTSLTLVPVVYDRISKMIVGALPIEADGNYVVGNTSAGNSSYMTDEYFDKAFDKSTVYVSVNINGANNRWNAALRYNLSLASTNQAKRYAFGVIVMGPQGAHFDMVNRTTNDWNSRAEFSNFGNSEFATGGNKLSVSNMACGPDMICIGAWNTRKTWGTLDGKGQSYSTDAYSENKIAGYSSYGTLADGRTLPVVCAPGTGIISSVSQYWVSKNNSAKSMVASSANGSKTSYWDNMQGTSMATPVAAGIGALWLQANPDLTPADIRAIIKQTSVKDSYVNNTTERPEAWGAGKIDALAGLKAAVNWSGIADVTVDPAKIIVLNNGDGWQVVAPGADKVTVSVYDMNGRAVSTRTAKGDTIDVAADMQPGIYVMNVNNIHTRKVIVK